MDINAKHYENLNIEPWDIMKADFTKEQWIGFLKGNILKYTLREKGENYKDAQKIQKYAEELAKAYQEEEEYLNELWENSLEEHNNAIMREPVEKLKVGKWYDASTFDREELKELLKIGTPIEVLVDDGKDIFKTEPNEQDKVFRGELQEVGQYFNTHIKLKNCKTIKFWFKIIDNPDEQKLEKNKWYDTRLFTADELQKLLPIGTNVKVLIDNYIDSLREEPNEDRKTREGRVHYIDNDRIKAIKVTGEPVVKYWFKIID